MQKVVESAHVCYTFPITALILETGRGDPMNIRQCFVLSVLASVVAYYLCKWFDGEE